MDGKTDPSIMLGILGLSAALVYMVCGVYPRTWPVFSFQGIVDLGLRISSRLVPTQHFLRWIVSWVFVSLVKGLCCWVSVDLGFSMHCVVLPCGPVHHTLKRSKSLQKFADLRTWNKSSNETSRKLKRLFKNLTHPQGLGYMPIK